MRVGSDARRRERATSRVDVAADGDAMDAIVRALTRRSARGRDEEDDDADEDDVRAFVGVIEKYREQPTVLDPMLGGVIEPLMDAVARASTEANENERERERERVLQGAGCAVERARMEDVRAVLSERGEVFRAGGASAAGSASARRQCVGNATRAHELVVDFGVGAV